MTIEEAKRHLLNPPTDPGEPGGRSLVEEHALALTMAALVAGFLVASPRRMGGVFKIGLRLLGSPIARRGMLLVAMNAMRRMRS